jgi:hypothetical protein
MRRWADRSAALDPGLTANAAPAATTSPNWTLDTTVRPERDLHHRHPVSYEDASQLDRVLRVVDLDERKHPLRPQQLGERHRCRARHVR